MTLSRTDSGKLARKLTALDKQVRDDMRAALLQSGEQKYIELAGSVHDEGDEAVANELIETGDALMERHLQELRAISTARERLESGVIDLCDGCGGEIGLKRLLVYPVALRCVACQDRYEKTHAHEAMPRL